jgi:hypothetical protein
VKFDPAHVPPIDEALADPNLLGAGMGDLATWAAWLVILKAAFALPLTDAERALFDQMAGGREPPVSRVSELWIIAGRRGGKSRVAGAVSAYLGAFCTHRLAPGETGTVMALAASKLQARTVFDYAAAFLSGSRVLRDLMAGDPTAEEIRLQGNINIAVHTANFRTVRSRTLIAAVLDETAFWRDADTSTNPDTEIYTALLPALATTNGMMIGISSPYRRAGLLFKKFDASFGKNDPNVLVVRAPSKLLNPTLTDSAIDRAREMDPEGSRTEWDAEWRDDLSDYIDRKTLMECVDQGVHERQPRRDHRYVAFIDPSGGGKDSFTLGIAHREGGDPASGGTVLLDAIREVRPGQGAFNPEAIVAEFATLLRSYRVSEVRGDRYGGEWPAAMFRKFGISYVPAAQAKSEIYLNALPLLNSGAVALIDHEKTIGQIVALERRPGSSGRDIIDHPKGGHDDVANAALGAVTLASKGHSTRSDASPFESEPVEILDPLVGW